MNPSFNLKVLQSFIPVFNEKVKVLIKNLDKEIGNGEFDVLPYVNWSTLDAICGKLLFFKVFEWFYPEFFIQAQQWGLK